MQRQHVILKRMYIFSVNKKVQSLRFALQELL